MGSVKREKIRHLWLEGKKTNGKLNGESKKKDGVQRVEGEKNRKHIFNTVGVRASGRANGFCVMTD